MRIKFKKILEQIIRFVGVSGIGWILDFLVYTVLGSVSENVVLNNIISSWIGVTFVFNVATRKIFKNNSKISLKWKYLIYIVYQMVLILLISRLLGHVNQFIILHMGVAQLISRISIIISKIVVTPITMVLNFIVLKNVIEKL